ncbi:hypothetical protein GCM10027425_10410 [Alteromonas gracilis]
MSSQGHTPPKGVQETAQRAVRWIEDGHAGDSFTDTGRHRAHQLAEGRSVSDEQARKMKAYFSRHTVDKDAEGFTRGDDGFPSPGRVAWDAWGGDEGERWVGTLDV